MAKDNHHNVYVNADGEQVVRVSHVVRTLGREQLIMWAHMLGWKHIRYKDELDRTANIGTFVHQVLENYNNPRMICEYNFEDYYLYSFMDRQQAYNAAESFFKWLKNNQRLYKVLDTEKTIVGKKAGGTIDLILESPFHKDKVILGDYKTSSSIHFTQFLQLSGYVDLYEEINGPDTVDGVVVIRMDKKHGDPAECKLIRRDKLDPYIECFKSLLTVALLSSALEDHMKFDTEDFDIRKG